MRWIPSGLILAATLTACAGPCPKAGSSAAAKEAWAAGIRAMRENPIVPESEGGRKPQLSIERFRATVKAKQLAAAFVAMMGDPDSQFDMIKIDRLPENVGRPFAVGEKFQGRYQIQQLAPWLPDGLACCLENRYLSDYGVIKRIQLSPPPGQPYELEYRYIGISPLAGHSIFRIQDVVPMLPGRTESEIVQEFYFQPADLHTERLIKRAVLQMHNRVVWSQAYEAARLAGGQLICSSVAPVDQVYPKAPPAPAP